MNLGTNATTFIRDIIRYFPSKFLPMLVAFLWAYIFTRIFTPSEYGIYGLIIAVTGPLITVLTEWAAQPVGRFYSEFKVKGDLYIFQQLVKKSELIILVAESVLMLILVIFAIYINKNILIYLIPASLSVIFNSIINLYNPILSASQSANIYTRIQVLQNVGRFIFALIFVLKISDSVIYLVWADAIASFLVMFPLVRTAKGKIRGETKNCSKSKLNRDYFQFLKYGIPMMLWFFSSQLLNVGDRYVIQWFLGNNAVGVYTANYQIISGVAGILNAPINLAAFPIIMRLWAEKKKNEVVMVIRDMTTIYAIISIGIVGGTALISKDLVIISLGKEYFTGYSLLVPLIIGFVFIQGSMIGHKGLELYGRTIIMTVLVLCAAMVNLLLNIIFVPIYGINASAWITLISYFVYAVEVWFFSGRYIKWIIKYKIILIYSIFGLLSFYIANFFISTHVIVDLLLKGIIFCLVYGIISIFSFYKFNLK